MTRAPLNLERVTVNLTPRARAARDAIQERTRDNLTDVVNRALGVYDLVLDVMERNETDHLMVVQKDGTKERVYFR